MRKNLEKQDIFRILWDNIKITNYDRNKKQ